MAALRLAEAASRSAILAKSATFGPTCIALRGAFVLCCKEVPGARAVAWAVAVAAFTELAGTGLACGDSLDSKASR
jgi:hypothetical protein